MSSEIMNAKISRSFLGFEGHGIFTATFTVDTGRWSTGFPQYNLNGRIAAPFIAEILKTVGVSSWEELNGQHVRVQYDGGIVALGHIIEDRWFAMAEFAKPYQD